MIAQISTGTSVDSVFEEESCFIVSEPDSTSEQADSTSEQAVSTVIMDDNTQQTADEKVCLYLIIFINMTGVKFNGKSFGCNGFISFS